MSSQKWTNLVTMRCLRNIALNIWLPRKLYITFHLTYIMRHVTIAIGLFILLLAGCDSTDPIDENEDAEVAGSYEASTFVLHLESGSYNILERGGLLNLNLDEDGNVEGRMLVPCSIPQTCEDPDAETYDVMIGGVYEVEADTVFFDHRADTFIREVPWLYEDGMLRAFFGSSEEGQAPDEGLEVVLTR